ncbi:hypothetical protein LLE87_33880, partial [Paenibacillus polymyxa]|nr:hypothetical protein [Paenibacillus polymyxa]
MEEPGQPALASRLNKRGAGESLPSRGVFDIVVGRRRFGVGGPKNEPHDQRSNLQQCVGESPIPVRGSAHSGRFSGP